MGRRRRVAKPSRGGDGPPSSYPEHWTSEATSSALAEATQCVAGVVKVNARRREEAFVVIDGWPLDVRLPTLLAQNRAIHGDRVAVLLDENLDPGESDDAVGLSTVEFLRRQVQRLDMTSGSAVERGRTGTTRMTGRVVRVLGEGGERKAVVGSVLAYPGKDAGACFLQPVDGRLPRVMLVKASLPEAVLGLMKASGDKDAKTTLVVAEITGWTSSATFPIGKLATSHSAAPEGILGDAEDVEAETRAILVVNSIVTAPFSDAARACLPSRVDTVNGSHIAGRKDFRGKRIFTIDPATARDLDDALSIEVAHTPEDSAGKSAVELLGDKRARYRLGVHIADVAAFVQHGTALDAEARERATSTYLVDQVVPMLPRELCDNLCSLNPGVDRLAFSVEWEVDGCGEVVSASNDSDGKETPVWFGRSVIRSATKLSYAHAQAWLDSPPDQEGACPEAGVELDEGHAWADVASDVRVLWGLAKQMRARRFSSGALALDNAKVVFQLDPDTGMPRSTSHYTVRESNRLVEELMLLANRTVASLISDAFPECAVLRNHAEPDANKVAELRAFCALHGVALLGDEDGDGQSVDSGKLHRALEALKRAHGHGHVHEALRALATRPLQLATYFSTGDLAHERWRHYALSVDRYTHFTSPIRRYPDLLVHRLLAHAASGQVRPVPGDVLRGRELSAACEHCNAMKLSAKRAQDASDRLFLWQYLKAQAAAQGAGGGRSKGCVQSAGVVVGLDEKFLVVYVPQFGLERRAALADTVGPRGLRWELRDGGRELFLRAPAPGEDVPLDEAVLRKIAKKRAKVKRRRQRAAAAKKEAAEMGRDEGASDGADSDSDAAGSDSDAAEDCDGNNGAGQGQGQGQGGGQPKDSVPYVLARERDSKPVGKWTEWTLRVLSTCTVEVFSTGGAAKGRPMDFGARLLVAHPDA